MSKRDQILKTTLDLVSEIGLHATSISLIIKKSGAAAGTIYYYFKSKEELLDTLYSELKKEMGETIIQNLNEQLNYKEKFFLIWKNLFYFYLNHPQKFEFLENYANSALVRNEIKEINQRYYQIATDSILSGIKMGIYRNLPIDLLINQVFGNVSTFVRMIIMEEVQLSDELLNKVVQSSWDGVKIN